MVSAIETVRKWWKELGNFESESYQNRYNMINMLSGFLLAAEKFGHITQNEADALFKELTPPTPEEARRGETIWE